MTESCDQDQQMGQEPQVAMASVVGPPPRNPPPPPPGVVMAQGDDVTEDWGSNNSNEVSDEEVSDGKHSQESSDESSDASEDAISVLAQAAVEDVLEVAVKQAQQSGSDANQGSIATEHELSGSMEDYSPRPLSVLGSQPGGEDFPNSDDSEDEGRWMTGQTSFPPPLPCPTSSGSASRIQASIHSEEDDDEEVTCEIHAPDLNLPQWSLHQCHLTQCPLSPPQACSQAEITHSWCFPFLELC